MTQIAQVLDVSGSTYTVPSTPVLNLAGGTVTVSNDCLDVDGNSWTVWYTQTIIPYVHVPVVASGKLIEESTTTGKITTTTNIRGRIV